MLILLPLHLIAALVYIFVVFTYGAPALSNVLFSVGMASGVPVVITWGGAIILLTVFLLMLESMKSVLTGWISIGNHILSAILFIAVFGAFVTLPQFANFVWAVTVLAILSDVLTGFVITAMAARRDLDVA